jgi:mgtE-like transporter
MVSTMSLGLLITLLTVKFTFSSFKEGLDPDTVVYPAVSTIAGIIITFLYIAVLNLYFLGGYAGQGAIVVFGLVNVLLVLYILPKNVREDEFINPLKESLLTMVLVAFMANITGTILKGISNLAPHNREIYTVYPAMIDMMGDVSLVIGSAATTKLALGILTPSFSAIKNHAKNIFIQFVVLLLFMILGILKHS